MAHGSNKGATDKLLAWILTYGIILTGFFLIGLSVIGTDERWPIWLTAFIRDTGLLLAAATGATLLYEKVLRDEAEKRVIEKLGKMLEDKIPKLNEIVKTTALRRLCDVRRNSEDYYRWIFEGQAQTLFFAGRSILHRIDADVRRRTGGTAEEVLFHCLTEGSKITILFLDPRIDILKRLAQEENHQPDSMLADIAFSLGISKRLADRLKRDHSEVRQPASLTIQIYDQIPYFAYHRQNEQMIIGFYFQSAEGSSSAAYEVIDERTKWAFDQHFLTIRSNPRARVLVKFDSARGGEVVFDDELFAELHSFLKKKLPMRVDQLLSGETVRNSPATLPAQSERRRTRIASSGDLESA